MVVDEEESKSPPEEESKTLPESKSIEEIFKVMKLKAPPAKEKPLIAAQFSLKLKLPGMGTQ